jgi:hypothetical protein
VQGRAIARRMQCFADVCARGNVNYATVVAKISREVQETTASGLRGPNKITI